MIESRLALAKQLGAYAAVVVKKGEDEKELVQRVMAAFGDGTQELAKPDVTIECSGAESSVRLGILVRLSPISLLFPYHFS